MKFEVGEIRTRTSKQGNRRAPQHLGDTVVPRVAGPDGASQKHASDKTQPVEAKPPSVVGDLLWLLLKVVIAALVVFALFTLVFGVYRTSDVFMSPSVKDGDAVMFYRWDKDYAIGEVTAYSIDGTMTCGRVVAMSGDTVDIYDDALVVNGSYQQESKVVAATTQFEGGVTFPLTVGEGQVFVLGDNRTSATDSRILGCMDLEDTEGTVIAVLRRRDI